MTTPTTTNADIVISKNNVNYQNYSFNPEAQTALTQAATDIVNLRALINTNTGSGGGAETKIVESQSLIDEPSRTFLIPFINSDFNVRYSKIKVGSSQSDVDSPNVMVLLPKE